MLFPQESRNLSPYPGGFRVMLSWIIVFLVLALVAAVFGFTGIASGAATIAQVLFWVFLVLLIISLFFGRRRPAV